MISKEIDLYDLVKVTEDFPHNCLKKNMVGTVIHIYKPMKIFEIEFPTTDGLTFCIETLEAFSIEKLPYDETVNFKKLFISTV